MTSRVAAIAALLCVALSGCATTTAGTATPAAETPLTTPESLPSLLLSATDVGAVMSSADMVVTRDVTAPWNDLARSSWNDSARLQDAADCTAIAGAAQRDVYAGSGWTALRGQVVREPPAGPSWSHFAVQAVVLFPSAQAAAAFFAGSRDRWAGCSDRELTYAQQLAPDQVWSVGPVSTDRDVLAVSRVQRSPETWSCQRALTVHANVAVDVEACSLDEPASAAADIARAIADRLPSA